MSNIYLNGKIYQDKARTKFIVEEITNLEEHNYYNDNITSDDNSIEFVIAEREIKVVEAKSTRVLFECEMPQKYVINGNTLYYFEPDYTIPIIMNNEIIKVEFEVNNNEKIVPVSTTLKFKVDIKCFAVENNSKFVILGKDEEKNHIIYCNDIKYYVINKEDRADEYNIIYDARTKKWLVVGDNGLYIIIFSDGSKVVKKDKYLKGLNVNNVKFKNGNIYVPLEGYLYIINTNSFLSKEVDGENIINRNSKIIVEKAGFCVINEDNHVYRYTLNKN